MIVEPDRLVPDFISAGANKITVHQEAVTHLHSLVQVIRKLGASPGVALNPATPASTLEEILPELDLVLAMTVNPGYGGQAFIPGVLPKITKLRAMIDAAGLSTELEVDGGVKAANVGTVVSAGADVIVAGSAVYNDRKTIAEAVTEMKVNMGTSLNGSVS
jgi:ribulose-phosphate 3-epimerase